VGKVLLRQGVETATRRETQGERPTSGEIGKDPTSLVTYETWERCDPFKPSWPGDSVAGG
jgi:hypothetical protein